MPPSDQDRPPRRVDWRAWIALAWAVGFGGLYAFTILEARAPSVAAAIKQAVLR